jgi:hypothetical protein
MIIMLTLLAFAVAIMWVIFAQLSRYEDALLQISQAHEGDSVEQLTELAWRARHPKNPFSFRVDEGADRLI